MDSLGSIPSRRFGRYELEADLMNLLDHPNLVARHEVGETAGRSFIAMEDLCGGDLRTLMHAPRATLPARREPPASPRSLRGLPRNHARGDRLKAHLPLVTSVPPESEWGG